MKENLSIRISGNKDKFEEDKKLFKLYPNYETTHYWCRNKFYSAMTKETTWDWDVFDTGMQGYIDAKERIPYFDEEDFIITKELKEQK